MSRLYDRLLSSSFGGLRAPPAATTMVGFLETRIAHDASGLSLTLQSTRVLTIIDELPTNNGFIQSSYIPFNRGSFSAGICRIQIWTLSQVGGPDWRVLLGASQRRSRTRFGLLTDP